MPLARLSASSPYTLRLSSTRLFVLVQVTVALGPFVLVFVLGPFVLILVLGPFVLVFVLSLVVLVYVLGPVILGVLIHDLLVVLDLKVTLAVAYEPDLEVALTLVCGKAVLDLKITLPLSTTASRYVSM